MAEPGKTASISAMLETAACKWPDRPAVTFEGKTQSWRETYDRCRAAATIFSECGVQRGDRVAYLGFNSNICFESYYSPALIGAILVPINYRLSIREMVECIDDCEATLLVIDSHFVEQAQEIQQACPSVTRVIYAGKNELPPNMISYESRVAEHIAASSYAELCPSKDEEPIIIFYTGGTTGRSKGAILSNRNFQSNTDCSIPLYRMQDAWRFIICGPLFHVAAGARIFSCTVLGGHAVILAKFDAEEVFRTIQDWKIDSATLVPTMFQMMLDHSNFNKYDLSSLGMVAYGAAPMSVALLSRVIVAFPNVAIYQTYGMTEASPILTSLDSKHHVLEGPDSRLGSVGKAVAHVELKIVDENDVPVNTGETGEIIVRGENIMEGYWNLPEQTKDAMRGGWYHTGDAGYLTEEGLLYLEGRVKDMIVSGGENIYPIEVENILSDHDAIRECAVIGVPHDTWGEAVHAIVVLNENRSLTEAAVIEFCKQRIASYKCPVSVSFRDEPMPMSAINKILKTELRKPFWEGRESKLV
ncbi:MAG: putative long-chain-fatty-acid CoA ligase [Pseudohongiella sp.]|nr:MAG: putative long-chain-fatty-acid CoA ligase [Pseudohongiella sp.]